MGEKHGLERGKMTTRQRSLEKGVPISKFEANRGVYNR